MIWKWMYALYGLYIYKYICIHKKWLSNISDVTYISLIVIFINDRQFHVSSIKDNPHDSIVTLDP